MNQYCFVALPMEMTKQSFAFTMSLHHWIIMHTYIPEPLGDNTLRIWDVSAPPRAQQTIRAHDGEVLTCDWAKYDVVSIRVLIKGNITDDREYIFLLNIQCGF